MNTQRKATQPSPQQQMAQEAQQEESQFNFTEPPDVKIIEASCKHSTTKSADNSEWVNVLDEPIIVPKGSMMRCASTFLDAQGIDTEIIQFTQDGAEKDNSHTMLTEAYIVNDGLNNKTTSYDYMTRGGSLEYISIGKDYTADNTHTLNLVTITGNGSGASGICSSDRSGQITGFQIVNTTQARDYSDGDIIEYHNPDPTGIQNAEPGDVGLRAKAITNTLGQVIAAQMVISPDGYIVDGSGQGQGTGPAGAHNVVVNGGTWVIPNSRTGGTGFDAVITAGGLTDNGIYKLNITTGGTGYKRGDIVSVATQSSSGSGFRARVRNVNSHGSICTVLGYFDQGYNYQRAPLLRWAQSFEASRSFVYGNGIGNTKYTAENNRIYDFSRLSSINKLDPCLNAQYNLQPKEDEFVSGFFHKGGYNKDFSMYKGICVFNSASPFDFRIGQFTDSFGLGNKGIECTHSFKNVTIDGESTPILTNPLNMLPVGSVVFVYFRYKITSQMADNSKYAMLYNEFISKYGGVLCVGENNILPHTESTLQHGDSDLRILKWGSPTKFDNSGESDLPTVYPTTLENFPLTNKYMNRGIPSKIFLSGPPFDVGQDYPAGTVHSFPTYYCASANGSQKGRGLAVKVTISATRTIESIAVDPDGFGVTVPYQEGDCLLFQGGFTGGLVGTQSIVVAQVDLNGGQQIQAVSQISKQFFYTSAGDDVEMLLVPMPFYQTGIGQGFSQNIWQNSWTTRKYQGYTPFDGYVKMPPTFDSLLPDSSNYGGNAVDTDNVHCGLFRRDGMTRQASTRTLQGPYLPELDTNIAHDSSVSLKVNDGQSGEGFKSATLKLAVAGTAGVHIRCATAAGLLNADHTLVFDIANMNTLLGTTGIHNFPTQGYFVFAKGTQYEEHMLLGGGGAGTAAMVVGPHTVNVTLAGRNLHGLNFTGKRTTPQQQAPITYFTGPPGAGLPQWTPGSHIPVPTIPPGDYVCEWIQDPASLLADPSFNWVPKEQSSNGTLAVNSSQNFFNTNDINLDRLLATSTPQTGGERGNNVGENTWAQVMTGSLINQQTRNTYNHGGNYYLTHGLSDLTTDTSSPAYKDFEITRQSKFFGFSRGMGEWMLIENEPGQYVADLDVFNRRSAEQTYNNTTLATNIGFIYNYERCFQQKTFNIDRNFVVPSDIANFWNRTSHAKTGYIDRDTGATILSPEESGLVQNEFIFPVYPSNNRIGPDGRYLTDYQFNTHTSGLTGGHIVGIGGIDPGQKWLVGDIVVQLPIMDLPHIPEFHNKRAYFIFFRNFNTFIRNYNPTLGQADGSGVVPNRAPIETIFTKASAVSNAQGSGKTTLAGQALPDGSSGGVPDQNVYELAAIPNANTPASFPSEATIYPIKAVQDRTNPLYDRLICSQYVGATNMTLTFSTLLSTFNFEFFYEPYASPFQDGQGGDISTRIFFGNRIKGLYNHDALSGINTQNWCRPIYPRGVFSPEDVALNTKIQTVYPNGIDPLKAIDDIGLRFLNKLGFINSDIGANFLGTLKDPLSTQVGFTYTNHAATPFVVDSDGTGITSINADVYTLVFNGTNEALIESDVAILSAIAPPENEAGLNTNNRFQTPTLGANKRMVEMFGDNIYYPYSINASQDSFNKDSGANIQYNNATDAYGSVGGLRISNMFRGMGLPNTTGSTSLTNSTTIPRTLNADCNLYLSYTVQTQSNLKLASNLPRKMTHGHLLILSSLIQQPSFMMSKVGAVNGMSIINKSFITGDFVLSTGQLQFYAHEDMVVSQITTRIVNSNYEAPSVLGSNSTVIYEIINYKPKPMSRPRQITEVQDLDYQLMEMVNTHLQSTASGKTSQLSQLENELYSLGMDTMTEAKPDVISHLRQQIQAFGIMDMGAVEKRQFFGTPEGIIFLQNAQDFGQLSQNIRAVESAHNEVLENVNDNNLIKKFNDQRLNLAQALRRVSNSVQGRSAANPIIPRDNPIPQRQELDPIANVVPPVAGVRNNIELVRSARARAGIRVDTRPVVAGGITSFTAPPPLKREGSSGIGTSIHSERVDSAESVATLRQESQFSDTLEQEDDDDKKN